METNIDAHRLGRWLDEHDVPGHGELPTLAAHVRVDRRTRCIVVERGERRMVMRMPGERADDAPQRTAARDPVGAGAEGHRRTARGVDRRRRVRRRAGQAVLRDGRIDGWSPMDGGWQAPFDTDLEARRGLAFQLDRGCGEAGPRRLAGARPGGLRQPGRIPRPPGRPLAVVSEGFQVRELPGLDVAAEWLRANRPAHFTPGIMHGDYQFANVMYAHGAPARLAALVDWEMTTIGDPLLDLAWALLGYDGEEPKTEASTCDDGGHARRSELLEHYETISGLSTENIDYYLVLANFKIGIVLERTYAGVTSGNGDPGVVEAFGPMVLQSIATAAELARSLPPKVR